MDALTNCWYSNTDLAERYGVSIKTIEDWRHRGVGPKGTRIGRHVRYSEEAVREFEAERIRASA